MKVRAIRDFVDARTSDERKAGDVFDATQARLDEINSTVWGMLATEIDADDEPSKAPRTRKTTKKAAPEE
jgi:hypothetical protein